MAGRTSKFTPAVKKNILEALELGASIQMACDYAGVSRATYYSWRAQALEDGAGKFHTFINKVQGAMAKGALVHLGNIYTQSEKDWRASAWILERRYNYKKDSTFEDKPEASVSTPVILTPESILEQQAHQLVQAIQQAESAQSWQAYAALQRQLLNVVESLRAIQAESEMTDSLDQLTSDQMIDTIVGTIISLPPVLRQQLETSLAELSGRVVSLK